MGSLTSLSVRANNIGGLNVILFLPMEVVNSIPHPSGGHVIAGLGGTIIVDDINISTSEWDVIQFTKDTALFTQKKKQNEAGIYYEIRIEGVLARNYTSRWKQLWDAEYREYAVVAVDNNGNGVLCGIIDIHGNKQGMKIEADNTSGAQGSDRNEYKVILQMESEERARPAYYETLSISSTPSPVDLGDPILPMDPID